MKNFVTRKFLGIYSKYGICLYHPGNEEGKFPPLFNFRVLFIFVALLLGFLRIFVISTYFEVAVCIEV